MECHICYEHFDSKSFVPKILIKCGHSFCKFCLERIINKKSSVQCPVCRENTKITKKENLPTNYSLIEVIEKSNDNKAVKNVLEKYKFFDDKDYKNVLPTVIRYFEPKKLNLKKIVNDDLIYVEEFENNQNISLFSSMPKRNRRYNFNRNSLFSFLFSEYSYSLWVYRKASKCKHSYSCLEHIIRRLFLSFTVGYFIKYPLKKILGNIFKDDTMRIDWYTKVGQWTVGSFLSSFKILRCFIGFYIDDILKYK
jgi:hypothetical protein